MKKCILYGLSFVLLFIGSLFGYSDNAAAQSAYDDVYDTVTQPIISISSGDLSFTGVNAHPAVIIDSIYNQTELLESEQNTMHGASYGSKLDHYNSTWRLSTQSTRQQLKDNWDARKNQIISYRCTGAGFTPPCDLLVWFSTEENLELTWTTTGVQVNTISGTTASVQYINAFITGENNVRLNWTMAGIPANNRFITRENGSIKNYLVQVAEQNIPEGYQGTPLRTVIDAETTAHKPNISYDVTDKQVTVYSDSLKNTATLQDYQIYWFISNTTFDMTQPTDPFAISGCTAPDFNNNFTVPIYFDYGIQAYYADEDCNILSIDDEGDRLTDNMVVISIDGSNFSGSTDDHVAIIGAIPENEILKAIRKFKPTDGGLASLVFAPIEAVASLPDIVGTCTPISLPLMGQNVSLTCIRPTIQNSPMGAVYSVISVIVTGMVTWFVAWRTFGTIKNIQDPQDDKVEVLKL